MTRKTKRKLKLGRLILLVAILCVFVISGLGCGILAGVFRSMPAWSPDTLEGKQTTFIYDQGDKLATTIHAEENRVEVKLSQVPKTLQDAFIATEDSRFWDHPGIDVRAIARAVFANLRGGWGSEGASTITQQLVRSAFLTTKKTMTRKIQEAALALELERRYTKKEIFAFYLNQIYFGHGAYGVQAAAQTYFGKDIKDLTLAESAMLVGVVRSPGNYSPYLNPEVAKKRRSVVLEQMVKYGYISRNDADKADKEPFKLKGLDAARTQKYPYYADTVLEEALDKLKSYDIAEEQIYTGGFKIYTTLDQVTQQAMEDTYKNPAFFPKGKGGKVIQSAMVVVDPHTGGIKGLIGGREYSQKRPFNRAIQAARQPGSSIKPLAVYGPALEKGFSPAYVLDDVLHSYPAGDGSTWTPQNYDQKYRGLIPMRTAVQFSINTYAVQLLNQIGVNEGFNFAEKLGISTLVNSGPHNDRHLSLALGGVTKGITPLEMAAAYGTFANQGVYIQPHTIREIRDRDGNILYQAKPKHRVAMSEQTAFLMTDLLQTVVKAGTGRAAALNRPTAGKTGTTQKDVDAWFLGYTPELSGAVWMGYDKEVSMTGTYGGSFPARIWKAVMSKALADAPVHDFKRPDNIVSVPVCIKSGTLPSELCPDSDIVSELFVKGTEPTQTCTVHVQAEICPESGQLATEYCPTKISGVFLKRPAPYVGPVRPLDASEELPRQNCTIHGPGGTVSGTRLQVCSDPRHGGQLFLANIPGGGQGGGCPPSEVTTKVFAPGESTPSRYCNLPDHQIFSGDDSLGINLEGSPRITGSQAQVELNWEVNGSSSGVVYTVERWTDDTSRKIAVGKYLSKHSFTDKTARLNKVYNYRIVAYDKQTGAERGVSDEVIVMTTS